MSNKRDPYLESMILSGFGLALVLVLAVVIHLMLRCIR